MGKFVCGMFVGAALVFTHAMCYAWGKEDKLEEMAQGDEPNVEGETVEDEGEEES